MISLTVSGWLIWGATFLATDLDRELERIEREHAEGRLELADANIKATLLNDAERLALLADKGGAERKAVDNRLARIRELRMERIKAPARSEYRAYLASRACEQAIQKLARKEARLRERIITRYIELLRKVRRETASPRDVARIVERALPLDPAHKKLARAAGKKLWAAAERERIRTSGIAALELGDPILSPQVTARSLRDKVVVWRSFSL